MRNKYYLILSVVIFLWTNGTLAAEKTQQLVTDNYYGTPLGALTSTPGQATGQVFASDQNTLFIKGFTFDGTKFPFSYFQAGPTIVPDNTGFTIADENGSFNPLNKYQNKDLIIKLPEGRTLRDVRWFSVWNQNSHVSMGHVLIPVDVDLPKPLNLPPLTSFAHDVRSGPITIVDAQTILIPNFWYDGLGPAAYWWMTRGARQSPQGLRLKDEKGSVRPLRPYRGETVLLTLPDRKTIYDFDWLGVWCEEFQVDFGSVHIPKHFRVPPSPAMLGLKPEAKLNCEILDDSHGFEMRWILDNDDIVIQLVGKFLPHEYMSIGWARDDTRSLMIGADAVVAWIDALGQGHVEDYYLSAKEPCVGTRGSCPDLRFPGATDSVTLLHAAVVNGFRMITFKRPQLGVDEQYDQHIYSDGQQAIIWAYGLLNHLNQASYHRNHQYGNRYIDFARQPQWNCPSPDQALVNQRKWQQLIASATTTASNSNQTRETRSSIDSEKTPSTTIATQLPISTNLETSTAASVTVTSSSFKPKLKPWNIPKIVCPKDKTLWAQMGPVGGSQRGYQALTGRQGWGKAWYINGLLIPEIVLKRGVTYTFWIEGGNNPENSAQRHPFYLTSSDEGGFEYKTPEERREERVFAGVGITSNGTIMPTAEGRRCDWRITTATNIENMDEAYPNFEDFHRTLMLECDSNGQPGMLRFTPDKSTPNLIYYQCYIHRYMGWKIRIVDQCPEDTASSSGHLSKSSLQTTSIISKAKPKSEILLPAMNRIQNVYLAKPVPLSSGQFSKPRPIALKYILHTPNPQQSIRTFSAAKNAPLMSSASSSSPTSSYFMQNFAIDPFIERQLIAIAESPSMSLLSGNVNPYTPSYIHKNFPQNSNSNLMMKKFGVRYPMSYSLDSKMAALLPQPLPLKMTQKTTPKPQPKVKIQSGGFVPITSNTNNGRVWTNTPLKSRSKNKFNYDLLRIRPMDVTKTSTSTTSTTTTSTTTTTPIPPTLMVTPNWDPRDQLINNPKMMLGLEYSNGLFSEDDLDEAKPLQSSASNMVPMVNSGEESLMSMLKHNNETDHTILSDVLRLIAHNLERQQQFWPSSQAISRVTPFS